MSQAFFGVYGLSCGYGSKKIIDSLSFEVEAGEIVAILGPNGSGKSTLLKASAGILPPWEGQVWMRGDDLLSLAPALRARKVAYVGADLRTEFPLTAIETVRLGRICHGTRDDEEVVERAMELCFCSHLRDRWLYSLSGGERQLVALAKAIAQGSRILFLDESLSKMDLNHQALVGKRLRELAASGHAILLVSHDANFAAEVATHALLLKEGKRLATGKIQDVWTSDRIAEVYPGARFVVAPSPLSGAPQIFWER